MADLKYSKDHEWLAYEDGVAIVGISDFAQSELGDLVFVNLPEEGDEIVAGEAFGDVESVKAVSDILSPVSGTVVAINEEILDSPELINEDAFGAWFIKVSDPVEADDLMTEAEYTAFIAE